MRTALRLIAAFVAVFFIHLLVYSLLVFLPLGVERWQNLHGRGPEDPLYWPWNQISHLLQVLFFVLLYWLIVPSRHVGISLLYGFLLGAYVSAIELGQLATVKVISAPITYATIPLNVAAVMASSLALAYLLPRARTGGAKLRTGEVETPGE